MSLLKILHTKPHLHIAISRKIDVPWDVLFEKESRFNERGKLPTLEQAILHKGYTLYAA